MKLSATYMVPDTREKVFAALVDPTVLIRCIPGCEEMTRVGEDIYRARLRLGIAGIKGLFTGQAEVRDRNPPASFTLHVDGKGAPGFVRGRGDIALTSVNDGTEIGCVADVQVGGMIASIGSRLVSATAKRMMDDFFGRFAAELRKASGGPDV
jgi:carbon monoxide dehydrogenase subunit G